MGCAWMKKVFVRPDSEPGSVGIQWVDLNPYLWHACNPARQAWDITVMALCLAETYIHVELLGSNPPQPA